MEVPPCSRLAISSRKSKEAVVSDEAMATSAKRLPIPADSNLQVPFETADVGTPAADEARLVAAESAEDLLERIKNENCPRAMEELFDRYFRLVLSIALKILRDDGEAEDLMQDVFFEVFRTADKYDRLRGSAKMWIMQVAYHRSLDRRQYLNVRKFYDRQELTNNLAILNRNCVPTDGWGALTPSELESVLRQAMKQLNDKQRATIEMFYFQDMDLREVAEKLQESYRNARNHMFRGMQNLRAIVHDLLGKSEKKDVTSA